MNLTCQVGGASGFAALNNNALASTAFTGIINSIQTDAMFHLPVLHS